MMNTLKLISLQHELGMAIGLELRLHPMLTHFIRTALRRLSLSGVHVCFKQTCVPADSERTEQHCGLSHVVSVPLQDEPLDWTTLKQHFDDLKGPGCRYLAETGSTTDHYRYVFNLGDFGVIVFDKQHTPLPVHVLDLLRPIMERLAISCQASLEHEQLLGAIQARKSAERRIVFQLNHDDLTHTANRHRLLAELDRELQVARLSQRTGALLFLDLNRFKSINDTLGHGIGDQLLQQIARLLQAVVRKGDLIARLSGDEFVILLSCQHHGSVGRTIIDQVVAQLRSKLEQPVRTGAHLLHVSASIGIAWVTPDSDSAERLLRNADTAMYLAKSHGPNHAVYFDASMSVDVEARLQIEKELQQAVKQRNQFQLFYQPQFDVNGACIGAEALLRWRDSEGRFVSPALFIPVAEETGLMLELGQWVLERACDDLRALMTQGLPEHFTSLSVNISALQFNHHGFVDDLMAIVESRQIPPQLLGLELTESALIRNVSEAIERIALLRRYGFHISIDDFGTGYSSLSYLSQFPVQTLKIDQAFVRNVHRIPANHAIVTAIVALGRSLKLDLIAEGVETEEELNCLIALDCASFQGFHFAKPQPFAEFQTLVSSTPSTGQERQRKA